MSKTFVGIGFGPIQSGLFLFEACASGNFERLVVAEVAPELVTAIRRGGGRFRVNVAHRQGIETHEVAGLEVYNPCDAADAPRLVEAIASADEIATALPSIDFYTRGVPSPAELLAGGLVRKLTNPDLPPAVVYAAENHNHAAELLCDAVSTAIGATDSARLDDRVAFVNTVIGKMSGVVTDSAQIERDGLAPLVADSGQAVLVEEFNRILIGKIHLSGFRRGIEVFQESPDLLPFEEAKLYGHNATHALLGYLAHRQQMTFISDSASTALLEFAEQAFLEESGGALVPRHAGVDSLFTSAGWAGYVRDLLERMVNPFLRDRVGRVIRDPRRKLGWNDRLIGTMRLALEQGIAPRRYSVAAAAAAELLVAESPDRDVAALLDHLWRGEPASQAKRDEIVDHILSAEGKLAAGNVFS